MAVERFKRLKHAVTDKVGDAAGAVNGRGRGGGGDGSVPPPPTPEVAALTPLSATVDPAERALRDAAQAAAAVQGHTDALVSGRQAELDAKPLQGPAGAFLYGTLTTPPGGDPYAEPGSQAPATGLSLGEHLKANLLGDMYTTKGPTQRLGVAPPMRDLVARQQLADTERATRDEIRQHYRSPGAWPVVINRFLVSADDQLGGAAAWLASSGLATRPDLVYGVSRVPDRLGGTSLGAEWSPVVEWEVVHGCLEPLTPIEAPPEVVWFDGTEPWVARAAGEPSVLDEDLALAFLTTAGIAPEHTLGIARFVTTDLHQEGGESQSIRGVVRGVSVLHRSQTARSATEQFQSLRWMLLPPGPPPGVHVEVLNWAAVASVVHREINELPEIPSRFPYLPSTPQELITAYLEVVGLWPGDCYSVQATRDEPQIMWGFGEGTTTIASLGQGPKLPCVDGVDRRRLHGTTHVVIAYRDRPEYDEGRQRWAAYQRECLSANLASETGAWRPVQDGLHPEVPTFLKGVAKVAGTVGKVANWDGVLDRHEGVDFKPHRYCWPPTTGE